MYVHLFTCTHYVCLCMETHLCMHTHVCVHTYVGTHLHIDTHMPVHTPTDTGQFWNNQSKSFGAGTHIGTYTISVTCRGTRCKNSIHKHRIDTGWQDQPLACAQFAGTFVVNLFYPMAVFEAERPKGRMFGVNRLVAVEWIWTTSRTAEVVHEVKVCLCCCLKTALVWTGRLWGSGPDQLVCISTDKEKNPSLQITGKIGFYKLDSHCLEKRIRKIWAEHYNFFFRICRT